MRLSIEQPDPQDIYTVAELAAEAREMLEDHFAQVWLTGEISNLARPSSGHLYFTLKDDSAQIRCALFRMQRRGIDFTIENGQQVLALAEVSLYEARGDFQLIVRHLQLAGSGLLQLKFNQLKQRLAAEGLFDPEHKKPIPTHPQQIGVVTSPSGAAVRDVIKVLCRRFPSIPVIIYPSQVQGEQAAGQLVQAIQVANQRKECDVLLVVRGGGSLEDLWPFNEEVVARAIFASNIPIVSGVGHEVDITIADFVADQRAATPSAAAELVSPNQQEWLQTLQVYFNNLLKVMQSELRHKTQQLIHLQQRLRDPRQRLQEQAQQLDQLEINLKRVMRHVLQTKQHQLTQLAQVLDSVSPLNTLKRGYSILTKKDGQIIRQSSEVNAKDTIKAQLMQGHLVCQVLETLD